MKNIKHFHHQFFAFNGEPDALQVNWPVTLVVLGYTTEQKALERARQMIQRDNYKLQKVWECNELDTEELKIQQLELMKNLNKHLGEDENLI